MPVSSVSALLQGLEFPWWPKAVEDLSVSGQSNGYHLQEMPALVVFMEGADDHEQKEVKGQGFAILS